MTEHEALWESHTLARNEPPRSDPYHVLILVDFHQVKLPEPKEGRFKGRQRTCYSQIVIPPRKFILLFIYLSFIQCFDTI